jgi:pyruvate dehydrogenase E2 component (dihydrolipoamide acetyltransferase)
MSEIITVDVPDIGDFKDVEIIEVLVGVGDEVAPEDPLITLESDKASMEIPSPQGGVVRQLKVKVGDRVSQGDAILDLEPASGSGKAAAPEGAADGGGSEAKKEPASSAPPPESKSEATSGAAERPSVPKRETPPALRRPRTSPMRRPSARPMRRRPSAVSPGNWAWISPRSRAAAARSASCARMCRAS